MMTVNLSENKTRLKQKKADKYRKLIQADEPVIDTEIPIRRNDLILITSWYHTNFSGEEGRQWLIDYTTEYLPELLHKAKEGRLYYVQPCAYARIALRGGILPDETKSWLKSFISNMVIPAVKTKVDNKVLLAQEAKKVRAEERADAFSDLVGMIEEDYDLVIKGGKPQMDVFKALQSTAPTGIAVREYVKNLKDRLKEIKEAMKKGNDFTEAYDIYPRMRLRAMESFYVATIEGAERYIAGGTTKKQRKPRAKKYVPVEKVISKVQLGAGTVFGLKTLSPDSVLDATAVVVYNNKYNQLSLLVAEKGKLSIKGTTIQGISETASIRKRIKKPNELLAKVAKAINVNAVVNILNGVKNTPTAVTGRLNEDTYLIKVF